MKLNLHVHKNAIENLKKADEHMDSLIYHMNQIAATLRYTEATEFAMRCERIAERLRWQDKLCLKRTHDQVEQILIEEKKKGNSVTADWVSEGKGHKWNSIK